MVDQVKHFTKIFRLLLGEKERVMENFPSVFSKTLGCYKTSTWDLSCRGRRACRPFRSTKDPTLVMNLISCGE